MANWDVVRAFAEQFLRFEGEPRRAPDKETAAGASLTQFAALFPTAADREWLRLFIAGVADEQARFFADEHARVVRAHASRSSRPSIHCGNVSIVRASSGSSPTRVSAPATSCCHCPSAVKGAPALAATDRRWWSCRSRSASMTLPKCCTCLYTKCRGRSWAAWWATTPRRPTRAGVADRLVSMGQVRAGALVLERVAPELLEPYMRYYLTQAGASSDEPHRQLHCPASCSPRPFTTGSRYPIRFVMHSSDRSISCSAAFEQNPDHRTVRTGLNRRSRP